MNNIFPGEHVKAFFPGESMWVKVLSVNGDEIVGILDNMPAHRSLRRLLSNF